MHTRRWIFPVQTNKPQIGAPSKVLAWRSFPSGVVPVIPSFLPPSSPFQPGDILEENSHVSRQQQQTCRRRGALRTRRTDADARSKTKPSSLAHFAPKRKKRGSRFGEDVSLPILQSQTAVAGMVQLKLEKLTASQITSWIKEAHLEKYHSDDMKSYELGKCTS